MKSRKEILISIQLQLHQLTLLFKQHRVFRLLLKNKITNQYSTKQYFLQLQGMINRNIFNCLKFRIQIQITIKCKNIENIKIFIILIKNISNDSSNQNHISQMFQLQYVQQVKNRSIISEQVQFKQYKRIFSKFDQITSFHPIPEVKLFIIMSSITFIVYSIESLSQIKLS
ncbi:unnamed protein product [Paramecium primaurelia]|uniref:Uncharacterized protein n=1 Tax=Paramecium primaurelia TaxID=5886 RepID=A0A8S1K6D9_PARPR|nr:unnamed protein product [Paramecium primaurelia]